MLTFSEIQKLRKSLLEQKSTTEEECGIVTRDREVIRTQNIAEDPRLSFEFEEGILDDAIASWHTHPYGSANLSIPDLYFFKSWPSLTHFIISTGEVRCYKVLKKGVICVDKEDDILPWLLEGPGR